MGKTKVPVNDYDEIDGIIKASDAIQVMQVISSTISLTTVLIVCFAFCCTIICYYTDTVYDMQLDIVGIAVVFPLVFSIGSAFDRREQALQHLATMKATAFSIKFAYDQHLKFKHKDDRKAIGVDALFLRLFKLIGQYFQSSDFSIMHYEQIHNLFSTLSSSIEQLREEDASPADLSRIAEAFRILIVEFELLRNIKKYRTPIGLRAYTKFFVFISPVIYSPLFAYIAKANEELWGALVMVVLYSFLLTGLDRIQDSLEKPFNGTGVDDVHFDEYVDHMRLGTFSSKSSPEISAR